MCMCILPTYLHMHHMHAWCLRSEESIGSPWSWRYGCLWAPMALLGTRPGLSATLAHLLTTERLSSPQINASQVKPWNVSRKDRSAFGSQNSVHNVLIICSLLCLLAFVFETVWMTSFMYDNWEHWLWWIFLPENLIFCCSPPLWFLGVLRLDRQRLWH